MSRICTTILLILISFLATSKDTGVVSGGVYDDIGNPISNALVFVKESSFNTLTDKNGRFELSDVPMGKVQLVTFVEGYLTQEKEIDVTGEVNVDFRLEKLSYDLDNVIITDDRIDEMGINWLNAVSGTGIYEAKKTEVIDVDRLIGNKAANVSRQLFARVPGLNIWENDGAGVQLGIGGRGLNPNRTSNFNVRQNGYDISADALGYPESYYTPPSQAIEKIEVIRGAASLQYGTQFGGMLNFKFKEGSTTEKLDLKTENTVGSFGLFNTFNSIGGTVGKLTYYGFYHRKLSDGWRPNSGIDQETIFGSLKYQLTPLASLKLEHTHMDYLAQQPGGLTDTEFFDNPRQSKRERNWFAVTWNITAMELDYRFSPYFKINNRLFRLDASRFALGNLSRIDRVDDPDSDRNLLKDNYNNWGNEFRALFHYSIFGKKSVLLAGNRYYKGMTLRKQGAGDNGSDANFRFREMGEPDESQFDLPSRNISFFVENIFNLSDKLSITPGVRYENITTEADGFYFDRRTDLAGNVIYEEQIEESKSKGRSFVIGGIGVSYKLKPNLEFYSNFSQNFRAINFNDIRVNNPSLVVDPNIDDESGYNIDIGARGNKEKFWRFDASLFFLSYNNRIGSVFQSEPDPRFNGLVDRTFRYRTNVADANIFGLEFYGEISLLRLLGFKSDHHRLNSFINIGAISAKYTHTDIAGIEGNDVEMVPPVNVKTGISYYFKDLGIALQYGYVHEHFSDATNAIRTPTAVEGLIPSYSVLDLSANYHYRFMKFEAGINNLTNAMYFTRRAAGYPGPGIIPSEGRSFYFTVGFDF